jgi:bifunctional non-homologous end joining protein LigD
MHELAKSITLYYQEANSDKVYQVQVEPNGSGFVVNFQFGRRGSTLQSGTKTTSPVSHADAMKIYHQLVNEKLKKGYTEGEAGTRYERDDQSGHQAHLLPQLLNDIDEDTLSRLMADESWVMQEKKDGRRLLIQKSGGVVRGFNRTGKIVGVSEVIAKAIRAIRGDFILDGEAVGDVYWAFDMLQIGAENLRPLGVEKRLDELVTLLAPHDQGSLRIIPSATTKSSKQNLWSRLKEQRAEGTVFKQRYAPYVAGRPASGGHHLKFKFTTSATCVVLRQNEGKRSVALGVLQHPGDGYVEVGNVTIPVNATIPSTGSLAEVRYLYAFVNGSLYQPVYLGERHDLGMPDSVKSLKFKQGEDGNSNPGLAGVMFPI